MSRFVPTAEHWKQLTALVGAAVSRDRQADAQGVNTEGVTRVSG